MSKAHARTTESHSGTLPAVDGPSKHIALTQLEWAGCFVRIQMPEQVPHAIIGVQVAAEGLERTSEHDTCRDSRKAHCNHTSSWPWTGVVHSLVVHASGVLALAWQHTSKLERTLVMKVPWP